MRRLRVAVRVEVDLDRGDLLAGARELLLQRFLVAGEEASDGPAARGGLEEVRLRGRGGGVHCY